MPGMLWNLGSNDGIRKHRLLNSTSAALLIFVLGLRFTFQFRPFLSMPHFLSQEKWQQFPNGSANFENTVIKKIEV
jgi:hypothetical protein